MHVFKFSLLVLDHLFVKKNIGFSFIKSLGRELNTRNY